MTLSTVARIDSLSFDDFQQDYFFRDQPFVLNNALVHWPAFQNWSPEYFKETVGEVPVTVEYYTKDWSLHADNVTEKTISFSEYVDLIGSHRPESTEKFYLGQLNVLKDIPRLGQDIQVFDYFSGNMPNVHFYYGISGASTLLHYDFVPNLYAQVKGQKRFLIYQPTKYNAFYPEKADKRHHFSQVNPDTDTANEFPKFPFDSGVEVILNEGDLLYLPSYWWHHVSGLTTNISVSFWWNAPLNMKLRCKQYRHNLQRFLHHLF